MKTRNVFAIVLVLAVSAVTVSILLAEPATKPAAIGVRRGVVTTRKFLGSIEKSNPTRRIRITWDPAGVSFDRKIIIDMLSRPRSLVRGLPEKIQKRMDSNDLAEVRFMPMLGSDGSATRRGFLLGDYQMIFRYSFRHGGATGPEVMETIVSQLQKLLQEEHKESIRQLQDKCAEAMEAQNKAHQKLSDVRGGLVAMAKDATRSTEVIWKDEKNRALISELEHQLQRLEIEMAAKKMRFAAVREQIAKIGREAPTTRPANDDFSEITAKLEIERVLVRARLDAARRRFGANHRTVKGTEENLAALEGKLADLRLLAEARPQRKAKGNLELAARLKSEQTILMIDIREMEARGAVAERQLGQARIERRELLAELVDRETGVMRIEHVKTVDLPLSVKLYERAALRADELRQELEAVVPPTVTIVK